MHGCNSNRLINQALFDFDFFYLVWCDFLKGARYLLEIGLFSPVSRKEGRKGSFFEHHSIRVKLVLSVRGRNRGLGLMCRGFVNCGCVCSVWLL